MEVIQVDKITAKKTEDTVIRVLRLFLHKFLQAISTFFITMLNSMLIVCLVIHFLPQTKDLFILPHPPHVLNREKIILNGCVEFYLSKLHCRFLTFLFDRNNLKIGWDCTITDIFYF